MRPVLFAIGMIVGQWALAQGSPPLFTDVCSMPPVVPAELQDNLDRLTEATAVLIQSGNLRDDGDHYTIVSSQHFTELDDLDSPVQLCLEDSLFHGEQQMASIRNGRTAFLVAPNIMVTAPHSSEFAPENYKAVFGWHRGLYGQSCVTGDLPLTIPKENVYTPVTVPAPVVTTVYGDMMAFYIDTANRPSRRYLRLRNSGVASKDDIFAAEGAAELLPLKLQYALKFEGLAQDLGFLPNDVGTPVFGYTVLMDGVSGSPIYDLSKGVVETVMSYGAPPGYSLDSYGECDASDYANGIRTLANQYDGQHDVSAPEPTNSASVSRLESLIRDNLPQPRLAPLQDTTYVLDVGATLGSQSSTYTLTAAHNATGTTYYSASVAAAPSGEPQLLFPGTGVPSFAGLTADQSANLTVTAQVPNNVPCGTYDRYLEVGAGEYLDRVRHRFEIGLKEFAVTPAEDWIVNDLGSPYAQTKTYTLTNTRPTATHVLVGPDGTIPDSNLILVNGLPATAAFDLGPMHSATDSATFTLSLNTNIANSKPIDQTFTGRVAIYNQPFACSANYYVYRNVTFKRGEQKFVSNTAPATLPSPTGGNTYGTPVRFDFDLSNEAVLCASDINVDLGFLPIGRIQRDQAMPYLKIQLTSPSGKTGVIWDRQGDPHEAYDGSDIFDGFGGQLLPLFHLDDSVSPPLGPKLLSYWTGAGIKGHWYIDISSTTSSQILAGPIRIDLHRATGCIGGGT
jgi:hypothetical protein